VTASLDTTNCPVPLWLPGGHLQTVYGALWAPYHHLRFVRQRVDTPDGDFIDFDWASPGLYPNKSADNTTIKPDPQLAHTAARRWMQDSDFNSLPQQSETQAVVLFHGLEGSSKSHYAQSLAQHFRARGWVVVVAHFRGCSGFSNRLARAYYSGDTADIAFMLKTVKARLPKANWHAIGASLGGNALLKYLGEHPSDSRWLNAAAAVSVPLDLAACGQHLSSSFFGRYLYSRYFLKTMKQKVFAKARRFPGLTDPLRINRLKTLREFDDLYTAPMHGYRNALHYWTEAASKPALATIEVPTLVLNARNDPFVPSASLPNSRDGSKHVLLHQPADGGHMGFVSGTFPGHTSWLPKRISGFFNTGF